MDSLQNQSVDDPESNATPSRNETSTGSIFTSVSQVKRGRETISRRTWSSEANRQFAFDWSIEIETCRYTKRKASRPGIRQKMTVFTDIAGRWGELGVSAIRDKIWNMANKK